MLLDPCELCAFGKPIPNSVLSPSIDEAREAQLVGGEPCLRAYEFLLGEDLLDDEGLLYSEDLCLLLRKPKSRLGCQASKKAPLGESWYSGPIVHVHDIEIFPFADTHRCMIFEGTTPGPVGLSLIKFGKMREPHKTTIKI